jgi:hypothetical protein
MLPLLFFSSEKEFIFVISSMIPIALSIVLSIITSFIAGRSLYLYTRLRSPRLFVLGLAMAIIALTGVADLTSSLVTTITLHTDWFLYIGQAVSFLFIFLSLLNSEESYQKGLMRGHIIISLLALVLLFTAPFLPDFPNIAVQVSLSSIRCILSFAIFFSYTAAFMSKQTRFSLLMATAFFLLSFGYLIIILQYVVTLSVAFDNLGDIVRMVGLIALLAAVITG